MQLQLQLQLQLQCYAALGLNSYIHCRGCSTSSRLADVQRTPSSRLADRRHHVWELLIYTHYVHESTVD